MIRGDIEGNWNQLLSLVRNNLTDASDHIHLLNAVSPDSITLSPGETFQSAIMTGREFILGFKRSPAAKRNHHAFEGGLVYHILEMWSIYEGLKKEHKILSDKKHVNDGRVLKAILYHDFHKGCGTYILESKTPWKVRYNEGPDDMLLPHDIKTISILNANHIFLDDEQLNALLWAEGGFSETKPKWRSMLAVLVYCLDELSGNFFGRFDRKAYLDVSKEEV